MIMMITKDDKDDKVNKENKAINDNFSKDKFIYYIMDDYSQIP